MLIAHSAAALRDLNGEHAAAEEFKLTSAMADNPDVLWAKLKRYFDSGFLMVC